MMILLDYLAAHQFHLPPPQIQQPPPHPPQIFPLHHLIQPQSHSLRLTSLQHLHPQIQAHSGYHSYPYLILHNSLTKSPQISCLCADCY